jgi:ABC-2 type transport system ATP-binding protein
MTRGGHDGTMTSPATAAIEATGLAKAYGEVHAVDGVSLTVDVGEFVGVLGPNGAGKTTLLEVVEGLRRPDAGEVRLLGSSPWPRDRGQLRRIGVQLQASAFFERLTAREQIRTFASLYDVAHKQADGWLETVGLTEKADTRTEDLSGGQRQRLAIACALVHEPELVFLDEPTAALDPQARRNLWDLLSSLHAEGRTVVLTTHHMDEAEVLCERVAIMDHGKILKVGSPAGLVRELDAPVRVLVAPGRLRADHAREIPGVDTVTVEESAVTLTTREPSDVIGRLAELDALEGLQVRAGTLEDVFLDLTGREYRA